MNRPLLAAQGLSIRIGRRTLLEDLALQVRAGERWGVLGVNGSGKTRLLETLVGLHPPQSGQIDYGDLPLPGMRPLHAARHRAFLPQQVQDAFALSVLDVVLAGRYPHLSGTAWETPADLQRARDVLAELELLELAERDVMSLSGGERQRVALAAVLAQDTPLLLLDEPFNHLDLRHQGKLLTHLYRMACEQGTAVLCAMHDLNQAACFASHAILLGPGARARVGPVAEVLQPGPLSAAFGVEIRQVAVEGQPWFLVDSRTSPS